MNLLLNQLLFLKTLLSAGKNINYFEDGSATDNSSSAKITKDEKLRNHIRNMVVGIQESARYFLQFIRYAYPNTKILLLIDNG